MLGELSQIDGMTIKEWYQTKAPRISHPRQEDTLDCRGLTLNMAEISIGYFCYVLDDSSFKNCIFKGSYFQSASAVRVDFTGCKFIDIQMSPIYAPHAIFKSCKFEGGFLMGLGIKYHSDATPNPQIELMSDLTYCDFSDTEFINTSLDKCNFNHANLRNAMFKDCNLRFSNLTDTDLTGVSFNNCEFDYAQLTDTPLARQLLLANGNNLGLDKVNWI